MTAGPKCQLRMRCCHSGKPVHGLPFSGGRMHSDVMAAPFLNVKQQWHLCMVSEGVWSHLGQLHKGDHEQSEYSLPKKEASPASRLTPEVVNCFPGVIVRPPAPNLILEHIFVIRDAYLYFSLSPMRFMLCCGCSGLLTCHHSLCAVHCFLGLHQGVCLSPSSALFLGDSSCGIPVYSPNKTSPPQP